VPLEGTTKRVTVQGALLLDCRSWRWHRAFLDGPLLGRLLGTEHAVGFRVALLLAARLHAEVVHGLVEQDTLVGVDRPARRPGLSGGRTAWSLGSGGGVGLVLCRGGVLSGPVAAAAVAAGVIFGSNSQRADAGLDGAIIPWPVGW
jgi:hypothetical protein